MRSVLTLLVNLFGARIWIFISVSKRKTCAFKRALSLVTEKAVSDESKSDQMEVEVPDIFAGKFL